MKNVLIYGYGRSGKSVEKVLHSMKISYKIFDDQLSVNGGCYLSSLTKKNILQFDTIVLSPGVSIFTPIIQYAKKKSIKVISELEFASCYISVPMIAVTGTNGKTTTVHLIADILNRAGYQTEVAGNVGIPLSEFIHTTCEYLVVEVSSFQLEAIQKFNPYIAVLLNIDSDHLDRHKTWENYKNAKLAIFKNNSKSSYAVVNGGDSNISCRHLNNVVQFDKEYAGSSAYIKNGDIFYKQQKIISLAETKFLPSNVDNALASICVAKLLNCSDDSIIDSLKEYKPLAHRLEKVAIIDGVTYFDDSKATNIHAVTSALANFDHSVILLLGGKEKDLKFKPFFKKLPKCIYFIVTFGQMGQKLGKQIKKFTKIPYKTFDSLKEATLFSKNIARQGDVVLLSPACSSFDEFSSYEERGKVWQNYVKGGKNGCETKKE